MAENKSMVRASVQPEDNLTEEIQRRAYEIYQQRGQQDGRALDDWLRAEKELRSPNRQTTTYRAA